MHHENFARKQSVSYSTTSKPIELVVELHGVSLHVQAARMQKAKQDAAKNWRATLSGSGAQIKDEINQIQDINRECEGVGADANKNKGEIGDQQPAMGVQERAQKDR